MNRLGQRQLGREVLLRKNAIVCFMVFVLVLRGVLVFRGRFSSWNAFCALNAFLGSKRIFSYVWMGALDQG
jgi:hypothetical protein